MRSLRPPVQQRVQPTATRAPDPRGAAGRLRRMRAQLQDAALPAPAHAGAARSPAPTAASARAATRATLSVARHASRPTCPAPL